MIWIKILNHMPLLMIRICFLVIGALGALVLHGEAAVPFEETGMKSFADWNPDTSGETVVSDLLEEAIEWSRVNQRTLFIPSGTYLVDREIRINAEDGGDNEDGHSYLVGDAYQRPVIRLEDGSFPDEVNPREATPVFRLKHVEERKGSAWIFFSVFSNIDFDLGNNPGAAALYYAAAQDSMLANIRIRGENFASGVIGFPGRNAINLNIEVVGGRVGFILQGSVGVNLTGVRCEGQSEGGIWVENVRGSTIVGFESIDSSPAIVSRGHSHEHAQLFLQDAKIAFRDPGSIGLDIDDRSVALKNVYVSGGSLPVRLADASPFDAAQSGKWQKIETLAIAGSPSGGKRALIVSEGEVMDGGSIQKLEEVSSAPDDLRARHLPGEELTFVHPEAVNALDFPGEDDREKIQNALNGSDRIIYVPKGRYELDRAIQVPVGKALVGDPGKQTYLVPVYEPREYAFVLETEDADGEAIVRNLFLETLDKDFQGGVHWRSSGGYMMNVRNFRGHGNMERDNRSYWFTGRAGGRFFGVADHRNIKRGQSPLSSKHRKVLIEGTSNSIVFYGLNLERGGYPNKARANPFFEAINSSNIAVLGAKTEPDRGAVFRISGCKNVLITSVFTHRKNPSPLVDLGDNPMSNRRIELALLGTGEEDGTESMVEPYQDIRVEDLLVYLRHGYDE